MGVYSEKYKEREGQSVMSFKKVYPDKDSVEIEIDKLVPFDGYPLYQLKGQRFTDMVENVKTNGIVRPIIVRPSHDGKYEILNGHYRVAAAEVLEIDSVPATVLEGLTDEQALLYVSDTSPLGLLIRHGVEIYDDDYKESDSYKNIENSRVLPDNSFSLYLDEYIERLLLTEIEVSRTYESIYDMGNPYELNDDECEYENLADEIIDSLKLLGEDGGRKDTLEIVNIFTRSGGYVDQLRKHLNFDLDSFDDIDPINRREKAKIIYFFYILKERYFPGIDILGKLGKPSMESVDNSFLGRYTGNGRFIKLIKHLLEKELSPQAKDNIKGAVSQVVDTWGNLLDDARTYTDCLADCGYEYDIDGITGSLKSALGEEYNPINVTRYKNLPLPPIATLYLKVVQHEYLGQVKDILTVHHLQSSAEYDIPPEYVEEMIKIHTRNVVVDDVEKYLKDKSQEIAKYVYLEPLNDPVKNKEKYRAIRDKKDHVRRFLGFCSLAELPVNRDDGVSELLIISCLQAIFLDDKGEIFDYTFHGYENHSKKKPHVQGALKNDMRTYDALQVYWVRKVVDRWYANIGRYDLRCKLRELEITCFHILGEILTCPDIGDMLKMSSLYHGRIGNA